MRTAVFVDVSNIYYCINKKFPGRKLDYEKYIERVAGSELVKAYAYGSQVNEEAHGFITCLKKIGYTPVFKSIGQSTRRINWDAAMAVDIFKLVDRVERVVIGTASPDILPIVNWLKDRGIVVEIVACGINKELKAAANSWTDLEEDALEVRNARSTAFNGSTSSQENVGQAAA